MKQYPYKVSWESRVLDSLFRSWDCNRNHEHQQYGSTLVLKYLAVLAMH